MGIREDVLALADDVDATVKGCSACVVLASGACNADSDYDCQDAICEAVAKRLRAIAENDAENVTTMSAYDLLSDEDRKAIAWVRGHGGIAEVKDEWKRRNNLKRRLEKAQDKVERQQRHIEELQRKLAERRDGINAMRSQMAEMSKRLMPEGMEWPKVDGELVDFKTSYVPSLGVLEAVSIYNNGACEVMSHDGIVKNATEIHVFKPKVVDADGVEIRVGDVVWPKHPASGDTQVVSAAVLDVFHDGTAEVRCEYQNGFKLVEFAKADQLTHRAPVLAADGKPLKVGEHVWNAEIRRFGTVEDIFETELCGKLVRFAYDGGGYGAYDASRLAHERPETWERINDDASLAPAVYCDRYSLFDEDDYTTAMAQDLVRRARNLAERGA